MQKYILFPLQFLLYTFIWAQNPFAKYAPDCHSCQMQNYVLDSAEVFSYNMPTYTLNYQLKTYYNWEGNNLKIISLNAFDILNANSTQSTYFYGINKQLDSTYNEKWNMASHNWLLNSKSNYLYDNEHRILEEKKFRFVSTNQTWQPIDTIKHLYYTNGDTLFSGIEKGNTLYCYIDDDIANTQTILTLIESIWGWTNNFKVVKEFDEKGCEITRYAYFWKKNNLLSPAGKWIFSYKERREYDTQGRLTHLYEEGQQDSLGVWHYTFRYEFEYGERDLYMRRYVFEEVNPIYVEHFYIKQHEISIHDFYIFPNPTSNNITITYSSDTFPQNIAINMWDISGKKVFFQTFSENCNTFTLSLPTLSEGLYFVQLQNTEMIMTKKLWIKY